MACQLPCREIILNEDSMKTLFFILGAHLLFFVFLYCLPPWGELKEGIRNFWKKQGRAKRGENLFRELSLRSPCQRESFHPPDWDAPTLQYKFYPAVIKELWELNRKWGTPLQEPWKRLKRDLYQDLQWTRRAQSIVREGVLQQILMSCLILLFCWSFESLNPKGSSLLFPLTLLYLLGVGCFLLLTRIWEKKTLTEGLSLWRGLVRLDLFSQARLSVQEALSQSEVSSLWEGRDPFFESMRKTLREAIELWQKTGRPLGDTLFDLREEYAFLMEQKMHLLLKRLKATQMAMAFLVILPSFFYLLCVQMNAFFSP